ncbi:hypothetical protein BGZ63DRAFT_491280 [Mariannaea sp. PMI_226]|nr:hypothetical protein BGZ63DRAFT_491280 [Mariannaea sp. PMI_226]
MITRPEFDRFASPNERRAIIREDLGVYHAVVVAAIYDFPKQTQIDSPATFFYPVEKCIERHPFLCVSIKDTHTEKPFYERVHVIDLENHVSIETSKLPSDNLLAVEHMVATILDRPFSPGNPPWRVVVVPLESTRCLVAFGFSHGIGDGPTGTAFHRTFLKACGNWTSIQSPASRMVETPSRQLPHPFDTPERLPISWSYLLAPLLKSLLPRFIASLLGLSVSVSTMDANTWAGSPVLNTPTGSHSKIKVREIEGSHLEKARSVARKHDAKLTGTIHQLILRALDKAVQNPAITRFVSQTPINMRRSIGISDDEMGNFISGCYMVHERVDSSQPLSEANWAEARIATRKLAECAATLQDQPVGLLRYVSNIRNWTLGKLGQGRDCSFEVSNVGVFDIIEDGVNPQARLEKMIFAQPGHVLSAPLCFNFVSVKGGSMIYTMTWQVGALGVPCDEEDQFVEEICSALDAEFGRIE